MKMTFSEIMIVLIITAIVGFGIILLPKTIECATTSVAEMPGYCFYLLPR